MSKVAIFHLAPHERFNYGDIMYSIILKEYLKSRIDDFDFYYVGIYKTDTSNIGAGKIITKKEMIEISKQYDSTTLFIGGGEFLGADNTTLFSHIGLKPTPELVKDNLEIPFIVDNQVKNSIDNIHYISFGGDVRENIKGNIVNAFNNYPNSIYVRENNTKYNIARRGVTKEIVSNPDLVELSSKFFKKDKSENYVLVQLGKFKTSDVLGIIENLKQIAKTEKIYLMGLGNCPRHNDDLLLKQIHKHIPDSTYIQPKDAIEQMQVISRSKLVIGTSLHLMITAHTYNIPWISVNPNIGKVVNYQKTWYNRTCVAKESQVYEKYKSINFDIDNSNEIEIHQEQILNYLDTLKLT